MPLRRASDRAGAILATGATPEEALAIADRAAGLITVYLLFAQRGFKVAALTDDGQGHMAADVEFSNPPGQPLAGTVVVNDSHAVSAMRFDWLATSCSYTQDTLDLTVNGAVVARVRPEPAGPSCACTPFVSSYAVPLAHALAHLHAGENMVGIVKSTGLPAESRSSLAWATATVTMDGVEQVVPIYDVGGLGTFGPRNICFSGSVDEAIDSASSTPMLPAPALAMSWQETLPCGMDLSSLANGPFKLVVTATDGTSMGADTHDFVVTMPSSLMFDPTQCDDGDPCTVDTCGAEGCVHSPIVCEGGGDACHAAATCDPASGQCVAAPVEDGTACDDGNACTHHDACQAGACTGADPVLCVAPDDCHVSMCRPRSGKCKVKRKQPFDHCRKGKGGKK